MTEFVLHTPVLDVEANRLRVQFSSPQFGAFEEQVEFPDDAPIAAIDPSLRDGLATLAALVMGTSYYKAAPVGTLSCDMALTQAQRRLGELTYGPGLGEFYVRNNLNYPAQLTLKAAEIEARATNRAQKADKAVVAFGGGKDSHVASAMVGEAGLEGERVSVTLSERVGARLQAMSEAPVRIIERRIDPRLIELSRQGKALNGHIPITAINSVLLGIYAAARGLDWVVFANERAASEPTMHVGGHPVNHQFSKSLAYEDALRQALASIGAPFEYFSVLRPVSELWTAHYLATRAQDALDIFASCNRNFVFAGPAVLAEGQRWCDECAKCVYTGALLAPFISPERHKQIFQGQPLHDEANMDFLREIAGLTDAKPWECVGERREVACALAELGRQPAWRDVPLIAKIQDELAGVWDRADLEAAWSAALDTRSEHRMPDTLARVLKA